jgi:hypothetical protein
MGVRAHYNCWGVYRGVAEDRWVFVRIIIVGACIEVLQRLNRSSIVFCLLGCV